MTCASRKTQQIGHSLLVLCNGYNHKAWLKWKTQNFWVKSRFRLKNFCPGAGSRRLCNKAKSSDDHPENSEHSLKLGDPSSGSKTMKLMQIIKTCKQLPITISFRVVRGAWWIGWWIGWWRMHEWQGALILFIGCRKAICSFLLSHVSWLRWRFFWIKSFDKSNGHLVCTRNCHRKFLARRLRMPHSKRRCVRHQLNSLFSKSQI